MQNLASLFVTIVTLVNSFFPQSNLVRILSLNPLGNQKSAVLSEIDEVKETASESNDSAITTEVNKTKPTKTEMQKKLEIKNSVKKVREERQKEIEKVRTKREKAISEQKEKREEFKEKLEEIRDQKKKKIVEKVDGNISTLNQKWINRWNETLTRLSEILIKIQTRTDEAAQNGKNVTNVNQAISDAEVSIAGAKTAVDAQSTKTYTISISTEDNLGQDVKATISSFHADIKSTRETIEAARRAVANVLSTLKGLTGETNDEN